MSFRVQAKLGGAGDLKRRLDGLKRSARTKILRRAIRQGNKLIVGALKAKAPRRGQNRYASGLLRKSVGSKIKVYRFSGAVVGVIGPRKAFKRHVTVKYPDGRRRTRFENPTHIAHLIERGVAAHNIPRGKHVIRHPGHRAQRWMKRGLNAVARGAMLRMRSEIRAGIEQEAKKR